MPPEPELAEASREAASPRVLPACWSANERAIEMSSYQIRVFGDPVLKQRAKDVIELDGALARVVNTMVETMYDASGVGLAAPQVGVQKRMFTYDVGDGPLVLINPEIVEVEGEWAYEEGCLSIPGFHFEIVRPKLVTISGVDLDGHDVVIQGDELLGRVFLHELDHLDGVLMIDRLDPDERRRALRELRDVDLVAAARERLDDVRQL